MFEWYQKNRVIIWTSCRFIPTFPIYNPKFLLTLYLAFDPSLFGFLTEGQSLILPVLGLMGITLFSLETISAASLAL